MERLGLVLVLLKTVLSIEYVSVNLPGLGSLKGSTNTTLWSHRAIYQFQGIPYAKPPSGNLRFKPPQTAEQWRGVLDATKFKRQCPQIVTEQDIENIKITMDTEDLEDCLHLNIYTPQVPGKCKHKFSVMFYIHGGSFRIGSARDFMPNYLLEQDVVLVVIQYRLGPLGFLSLQNKDVAGNMGLLDQVTALEWVNKHIDKFCGDPDQVTIFGQSAGAAAVSLMLVSPLTNTGSLFQKAIVQSGSSLCDWAVDHNPVEHARNISQLARCAGTSVSEMYSCLMKMSVHDILEAHSTYLSVVMGEFKQIITKSGGNHAVIQIAGDKRFLTEDPRDSYEQGRFLKVPMMVGTTKDEGSFLVGNLYDLILEGSVENNEVINASLVESAVQFTGIDDRSGMLTDLYERYFFEKDEIGNFSAMVPGLIDLCGATLLKACTLKQARQTYKDQSTYLYTFNYFGHLTKFGYGVDVNYPFSGGVAHSDDLIYLSPFSKGNLTDQEKSIAKTMVELWTNFAIYGKPSPATGVSEWPAMDSQDGPYLVIDKHPSVQNSYIDQYRVTSQEGLDPDRKAKSKNKSSLNSPLPLLLILILFLLNY